MPHVRESILTGSDVLYALNYKHQCFLKCFHNRLDDRLAEACRVVPFLAEMTADEQRAARLDAEANEVRSRAERAAFDEEVRQLHKQRMEVRRSRPMLEA